MTGWVQKLSAVFGLLALLAPGAPPIPAQASGASSSAPASSAAASENPSSENPPAGQISSTPQSGFTLKANAELVLTNVIVRDAKTGEPIRGLKQGDFKIFENGKEQQIDSFDFESVDMATPLKEATVSGLAAGPAGSKAVVVAKPEELRNHRLIVMFFDLTSMQPEISSAASMLRRPFSRAKCSRPI